jgi:cytochrome b
MNMRSSRILVWDLPTRLFHWLAAASFAGAWLTAESERWRNLHALFGYTLLALVGFRIVWGIVGTRHARFASFAYGPRDLLAYLRSMLRLQPPHYAGHNPAGAWAIYALLAIACMTIVTGIATLNDAGGHWLEDLHEGAATAMLAVVLVHIAGVLVGSVLDRENLPRAMITGFKAGERDEAIGTRRPIAAAMLVVLVVGVWTGVVPLPGIEHGNALTAIKADVRHARHTGRHD